MAYPEHCIKGIPNDNCLEELGDSFVANINLFCFPRNRRNSDGWIEESVNWMDDEKAIEFTLEQEREAGELQFKAGVGIISRIELERVKKRYCCLDYERSPLENNSYHGNILLDGQLEKHLMTQIRALLADATRVIPREASPNM